MNVQKEKPNKVANEFKKLPEEKPRKFVNEVKKTTQFHKKKKNFTIFFNYE